MQKYIFLAIQNLQKWLHQRESMARKLFFIFKNKKIDFPGIDPKIYFFGKKSHRHGKWQKFYHFQKFPILQIIFSPKIVLHHTKYHNKNIREMREIDFSYDFEIIFWDNVSKNFCKIRQIFLPK